MSSVKPATTLVFDSFCGNSLVYLIVLFRQKFPLVSIIVVLGLANISCCCDHCVNVANKPDKKCETKDSSLRNNFVLEPRNQRFPGSLSLSLRRVGRREPWERGCHFDSKQYQFLDKADEKKKEKKLGHSSKEILSTVRLLCFFTNLRRAGR